MTAGGRWRGSRPHPVSIQRRTPAASRPVCVTESYDGADADVSGYDLGWDLVSDPFWGGNTIHDNGPNAYTGTHTNDALEVIDNQLAVTLRPSPTSTSSNSRSYVLARTQSEASSDDVRVETTIAKIPVRTHLDGNGAGYGVMARMEDDPLELGYQFDPGSTGGYPGGYLFQVTVPNDSGPPPFYTWTLTISQPGFGTDPLSWVFFGDNENVVALVVEGDVLAIEVTGTPGAGGDLRIRCFVNDTVIVDLDADGIEGLWGDSTVWDAVTFPAGRRAGVLVTAQITTGVDFSEIDHDVRIDNFSICPTP